MQRNGVYMCDNTTATPAAPGIPTAPGTSLNICPGTKKLKVLITLKDGQLFLDPWAILDHRVDPSLSITTIDPCYGQSTNLNAGTGNDVRIDLRRGIIGNLTKKVQIPYQTWIFGVNTISVRFRPKVIALNDSKVYKNAAAGINLGLSYGRSWGFATFTHRSANSWSITPSVGLGFSTISLSKEPLRRKVSLKGVGSNFALTPSL